MKNLKMNEKFVAALEEKAFTSCHSIHPPIGHGVRTIEIPRTCKYVVVLAHFYSGNQYSCHRTQAGAIKASKRLTKGNWSHEIRAVDIWFRQMEIRDTPWGEGLVSRF